MTDQEQLLAINHFVQPQTLMNPASEQAVPLHVVNEAARPDVQPPPAAQPGKTLWNLSLPSASYTAVFQGVLSLHLPVLGLAFCYI